MTERVNLVYTRAAGTAMTEHVNLDYTRGVGTAMTEHVNLIGTRPSVTVPGADVVLPPPAALTPITDSITSYHEDLCTTAERSPEKLCAVLGQVIEHLLSYKGEKELQPLIECSVLELESPMLTIEQVSFRDLQAHIGRHAPRLLRSWSMVEEAIEMYNARRTNIHRPYISYAGFVSPTIKIAIGVPLAGPPAP